MKKHLSIFVFISAILFYGIFVNADVNIGDFKDVQGVVQLDKDVIGAGLLTEDDIKNAKARGVKTIVDLRSPQEGAGEERILAKNYGMNYFNIPVTPESLRKAQADVISHILSDEANKPVIIHCGSGNRTGGLWAVYSKYYRNMSAEEAFNEGVDKGLRKADLKAVVRGLLEK